MQFFQRQDCGAEYTIGEVLGTGSFAVVRKAVSKADGSVWAVKVIEKAKLEKEVRSKAATRTSAL
jgi:serine/threonine protein kinase